MAHYNKIGLLLLDDERTHFLVCEKGNFTSDYIMPGGQVEVGESDVECLVREVQEELSAEVVTDSLVYVGEYVDVAAGDPTKDVSIKLYEGTIQGEPVSSSEIIALHWLSAEDLDHPRLSPIIKRKILPDIIKRGLLYGRAKN